MSDPISEKSKVSVTIRLPKSILNEIDHQVALDDLPISRNHWIVDALVEKIKKTRSGN